MSSSHADARWSGYRDVPASIISSPTDSQASVHGSDVSDLDLEDATSITVNSPMKDDEVIQKINEAMSYMQIADGPRFDCVYVTLSKITGLGDHSIKTFDKMLDYLRHSGTTTGMLDVTLHELTARRLDPDFKLWRSDDAFLRTIFISS